MTQPNTLKQMVVPVIATFAVFLGLAANLSAADKSKSRSDAKQTDAKQTEAKHYERPYNNRKCLHCHLGARSFEESAVHTADPDLLPAVKANKVSCLSSGCHDVVHNVAQLSTVKFWKAPQ